MAKKELGRARYHAYRLLGVTYLIATGETSHLNDKFDFEQLPFRIFPPMFAFYVITPDIGLPATKPFSYQEAIIYPTSAKSIRIQDADGMHDVPIAEVVPPIDVTRMAMAVDGPANYCVFSWIGINRLLIAKCDATLPTVYIRVFGPASLADCEKYVADNGGFAVEAASGLIVTDTVSGLEVLKDSFRAWIDTMPMAGPKLYVTGDVVASTSGWRVSFAPASPQGFNPFDLIMDIVATPPTGQVLQVKTPIPLRYEEAPPRQPYTSVTIRYAGGQFTIGVGHTS
ncbi:hypothetical protein [Pseudolabrys sp. FHR47]|uniref:hypothetical protein n=1 Tax=Pseudolabrys sp. FHR47 TaxID=2562284 RepID=UPI0010BF250D|nr:hypothetical protein [Pseudolabrys sp. FHR47]